MTALLFLAAVFPPKSAQPKLSDVLRDVIDNCRSHKDDAIVVCGNRDGESPYRLPPALRDRGFRIDGAVDSVSRERHKLMDVGAAGTHSCSATGAGGWTGGMQNEWERADQQRGLRPAGRFKR